MLFTFMKAVIEPSVVGNPLVSDCSIIQSDELKLLPGAVVIEIRSDAISHQLLALDGADFGSSMTSRVFSK